MTPDHPKIVQLDLNYRGVHSINLIKIARAALDSSLVQARDLIQAAQGGNTARNVRMTETQFGRFVAMILADPVVSLAEVRMSNVAILASPPPISFDFTVPQGSSQSW